MSENEDNKTDIVEHDMLDDNPDATTSTEVQKEVATSNTNQTGNDDMSDSANKNQEKPAKKGSLVPVLALLTGIVGTGLGVYNYDQARKLRSTDHTADLKKQVTSLETKIAELSASGKKSDTDITGIDAKIKAALATLEKTKATNKDDQGVVNKRLTKVEQLQTSLSKTLEGDLKTTLDERLTAVTSMLSKVEQIEMKQQGIDKNLQQIVATNDALSPEGMAKQEIAYLVRMAEYKIIYEGDTLGAKGLIKLAKDKQTLLNKGNKDAKIITLEQAYQLLDGVKSESNDVIIANIKSLSESVNKLTPKEFKAEGKSLAVSDDTWGKIEMLLVSGGMKVIPGDPNNISISAETGLVEKRFLQIDLFTAELAIRSQNLTLLGDTLADIDKRLDTYFAVDDNSNAIKAAIKKIRTKKLKINLPDLSQTVKLFESK